MEGQASLPPGVLKVFPLTSVPIAAFTTIVTLTISHLRACQSIQAHLGDIGDLVLDQQNETYQNKASHTIFFVCFPVYINLLY